MRIGLKALWILVTGLAIVAAAVQVHGPVPVVVAARVLFVVGLLVAFFRTALDGRSTLAMLGLMAGIGVLVAIAAKWLLVLVPSLMLGGVFASWWRSRREWRPRFRAHKRAAASVE